MPLNRTPYGEIVFFGPPNRRQKQARRRFAVALAIVALAAVAWIAGAVSNPQSSSRPVAYSNFTSS